MTASYIWSRGIAIFTQRDLNLGTPVGPYTYTIQDAAGNNVSAYTTPVFDSNLLRISATARSCRSKTAASPGTTPSPLQLLKRFSHGFTGQINYTWSHAIDDANMQGASNNISSTFNNATFNGNYPLDKGSSTLDQRHRLSVNWLWKPTFTTSTSTFAKYFVNGWELSGITTIASAHPVSPTMAGASTSANGVFHGVTLANSTLNGSGGWNRVPFLPVGSLDIDQTYNVDARLTRSLPFSERVKANLLFEAFNAFNTIHNTAVQTTAYTVSAGGILKPAAHRRRIPSSATAAPARASPTAPTPAVCRLACASCSNRQAASVKKGAVAQAAAPLSSGAAVSGSLPAFSRVFRWASSPHAR